MGEKKGRLRSEILNQDDMIQAHYESCGNQDYVGKKQVKTCKC